MKSTVAPYETGVKCLRIVAANGTTLRLTRYPYDLKMSNGQVYKADSGYDFSAVISETSFAASAVDLEGFVGVGGITRDQIASGVFDGARAWLFATDFLNPVEDEEELMSSVLGKTTLEDDRFRIEDMALLDLLGQTVSDSFTAACPKTVGSQGHGGCGVDLPALEVVGAVTSVTSDLVFVDSSRAEAADYFGWGTVQFTSGANAGLAPIKVRDFTGGIFTLYDPPYYPLANGVPYVATPGCRGRMEDCRDKFGNIVRFGGFPWVPTGSTYRKVGGA
jgi:uncharacterized phage protein (TIGR02218 family)